MSAVPDIAIGVPGKRQRFSVFMLILAVLFIVGAGNLIYLLATRPESIPWSFLTASFVFLLGVSQFGIAFVAIMRICRTKWARPYYRVGEVATLSFLPFAFVLFLVIFAYGREHLFFWLHPEPGEHLSPWLNENFLLLRNLVAQGIFYLLAIVYFLTGLIPDASDDAAGGLSGWLGSQKQKRDLDRLKTKTYMLAPVLLVVAVISNTFIAWDFGMMLFPHYHSTVFPMYFILGNMLAGASALVILAAVTSRVLGLSEYFTTFQLKSMGITITGFALLWIYMFWAQFFVTWYGNLPHETAPLWSRMFGHYSPLFWTMIACVFGVPIGTMIFAYTKRNWWSLLLVSAVIVVGVWLNRYLLVMPASTADHTPFSSLDEVLLVAGLMSGFLLVFLALIRVVPMISAWERRDALGEEGPAY